MKLSIKKTKPYSTILLLSFFFIITTILTTIYFYKIEEVNKKYMVYYNAVKDVQIEALQAHLLIEHILTSKNEHGITEIIEHLKIINGNVTAILEGGTFQNTFYFPVKDKELRKELTVLKEMVVNFKNNMLLKENTIQPTASIMFADQLHNIYIMEIISQSNKLEDKLMLFITDDMELYDNIQNLMLLSLFLLGAIIIIVIYRYERKKWENYNNINSLNKTLSESEEKYRLIVENSHIGIGLINSTFQLIHVNAKFTDITGYPIHELLNMNFSKLLAEESLEKVKNSYLRRQSGENVEQHYEFKIQKKDLTIRDVEVYAALIKNENEEVKTVFQVLDVTNRNEDAQKIKHLSQRLVTAQEEERSNISRDLHDDVGQELTALKLNLLAINDKEKSIINECIAKADRINKKIRNISHTLRPSILDDLGLVPAIRSMLNQTLAPNDLIFDFQEDIGGIKFSKETEITCYRIVQETMTNILRHAQAKSVTLKLWVEQNKLHSTIADNGKGFDVNKAKKNATTGKNFGILNMENRAVLLEGFFEIKSTIGKGTEINVILPC
tara:strand:+ start:2561 stop:4228 length:1668 start_codon:yes stop_codon:yes gene_type:complete